MSNTSLSRIMSDGIVANNPVFRLALGMCPTLAVTTSAVNGLGMGLSTLAVLVFSNMIISMLRRFISPAMRIPAFLVTIATFVTIMELAMKAYLPALSQSLGLYIPLIVVNCVVFARVESFASKNTVWLSALDGLAMGLGFTLALTVLSVTREIIGAGTIFGASIPGISANPALMFILPPGGFLTLGLVLLAFNKVIKALDARKKEALA